MSQRSLKELGDERLADVLEDRRTVPTDDGDLLITVVETDEGWRVVFYEQVDR